MVTRMTTSTVLSTSAIVECSMVNNPVTSPTQIYEYIWNFKWYGNYYG